jgi:hypothetical protein
MTAWSLYDYAIQTSFDSVTLRSAAGFHVGYNMATVSYSDRRSSANEHRSLRARLVANRIFAALQLRIAANIVDRAATLCLPQNKTGVLSASLGL